jgi:Phospholipase_D-nuclease N-terminal
MARPLAEEVRAPFAAPDLLQSASGRDEQPDLQEGAVMNEALLLAQEPGMEVFRGVTVFIIFFWTVALLATIFWIWMLVDALMSPMETDEKILWFLVIFFLHFIGALIYYFVRQKSRSRARTYP